jgi:hypothetical protein
LFRTATVNGKRVRVDSTRPSFKARRHSGRRFARWREAAFARGLPDAPARFTAVVVRLRELPMEQPTELKRHPPPDVAAG